MAICTQCGAIMHIDDAPAHVCKTENVAKKGEVILNGIKSLS